MQGDSVPVGFALPRPMRHGAGAARGAAGNREARAWPPIMP